MSTRPAKRSAARQPAPHAHHKWCAIAAGFAAIFCFALLIPLLLQAASRPTITAVITAGGPGVDFARDVVRLPDGTMYVAGSFRGLLDLDGTEVTGAEEFPNAFLAKYAPDQTLLWVRTIMSDGTTSGIGVAAYDVRADAAGNPYLAGAFESTVDFGEDTTLTSAGGTDLFVAKYDANGNLLWARGGGSSLNDTFGSLLVEPSGRAVMAAACHRGTAGATFEGVTIHDDPANSGRDWCAIAYEPDGSLAYAKHLGGITNRDDGLQEGMALVAADGAFYLAGILNGPQGTAGSMDGTPLVIPENGGGNSWAVSKWDADFGLEWIQVFGSPGLGAPYALLPMDGGLYLTGRFQESIALGGAGTFEVVGTADSLLARLNPQDGSVDWANAYADVWARSLTTDGSFLYLSGGFISPGTFGMHVLPGTAPHNGFAAKIRTDGEVVWAMQMAGSTGTVTPTSPLYTAWACAHGSGLWCVGAFDGTGTFSEETRESTDASVDLFIARIEERTTPTSSNMRPQAQPVANILFFTSAFPPDEWTQAVAEGEAAPHPTYATYYRVWSPTHDRLENVRIEDPACARVVYLMGDENKDGAVSKGERWVLACAEPSRFVGGTPLLYAYSGPFFISQTAQPE